MYKSISATVAAYDDMLNEIHEWARVGWTDFAPADILRALDPIAYKCGWIDRCDAEGIDTDDLEDDYTFERDRW